MGFLDRFRSNPADEKKKRKVLSVEEKKRIDELLEEDPSLTYEELAEEIDRNTAVISRYLQRKRSRQNESVQDLVAESKAKITRTLLESGDPALTEAIKSAVIAEISGKAQETPFESIRKSFQLVKELKENLNDATQQVGGFPDMVEDNDPWSKIREAKEFLGELRELQDELSPREASSTATEIIRELKPFAGEFFKIWMMMQGMKQPGAVQEAMARMTDAPLPTVQVQSPVRRPLPPPQYKQLEQPVEQPDVEEEYEEVEETQEVQEQVPQPQVVSDMEVWGMVLQTIVPLLEASPSQAADIIWHTAEIAHTSGIEQLYNAYRQLSEMDKDELQQVLMPILIANPQLAVALKPFMDQNGEAWLRETQSILREIFRMAESSEEEEEEVVPIDFVEEKKKRGRPKKTPDGVA